MRKIGRIILHCSASDSREYDYYAIKSDHIDRGWSDIGYHYLINKDGKINIGRPLWRIGAHAKGYNRDSIGICLMGLNYFTQQQFESLAKLIGNIRTCLGNLPVYPHNRYNESKTCPNFDVNKFIEEYL